MRSEGLGKKRVCSMVGKILETILYIQYFLHLVLFSLCAILLTAFVLHVFLSSYVYLLYLMCICCTMCVCNSYFRCRTAG